MELLVLVLYFVIIRQILSFDCNSQILEYSIMFITQFAGLFLPLYILKKLKKEKLLTKEDFKISPVYILGAFAVGTSFQFVSSLINMPFLYIFSKFGYEFSTNITPPENNGFMVPYMIISCIIPAFFEEIFFRKYTYDYLKKHSVGLSVVLSAVIFSALHFELTLVVCVFLLGIILSLFIKQGYPLIFTMVVHFSNNLSGLILQSLNEKTIYFLNKYFFLFAVLSFFVIIFMLKNKQE